MRKYSKILSSASSFFFIAGFILNKIRYTPLMVFSPILVLVSLGCNLIGYALWFISSHFYPEQSINNTEWYGFAQFKEQHLYAATIGILATAYSIIGFFFPILLIPASWLFFGSNVFWSIGEYHKLNNPPLDDAKYSASQQEAYFSYTAAMTSTALVTALSATLMVLFPPIAIPIFIVSSILTAGLGLLAAHYWLDFTFGNHLPIKQESDSNSHTHMNHMLGSAASHELSPAVEPYHGGTIFPSQNSVLNYSPSLEETCITPR